MRNRLDQSQKDQNDKEQGSARAFSGVGSVGRQCQDWPAASLYPHMHALPCLIRKGQCKLF
jgi:hypothetical protein